jgi:uncharacterized protein YkwD
MNKHHHIMKLLFLFMSGALVLSWCAEKTAVPSNFENTTPRQDKITAEAVLQEVNTLRAAGCKCPGGKRFAPAPALRWDEQLEKAAQDHADDMKKRKYFNHTSPDGTGFSKRIRNAGYDWQVVGENIAMGYPTAAAVVEAWRTSKDHCPNLMSADFRDMGVGKSGPYWVQDLGARAK